MCSLTMCRNAQELLEKLDCKTVVDTVIHLHSEDRAVTQWRKNKNRSCCRFPGKSCTGIVNQALIVLIIGIRKGL